VSVEEGEKLLVGSRMHAFILKRKKSVDRDEDYIENTLFTGI
jgi:hypothetical protein